MQAWSISIDRKLSYNITSICLTNVIRHGHTVTKEQRESEVKQVAGIRENKRRELREYFMQQVADRGQNVLQLTYQEIARGSGVSLGTVVKGLKMLESEGFLEVRRGPSRRIPNAYAVHMPNHSEGSYRSLKDELEALKMRVSDLESELAAARTMLGEYERADQSVLVRTELPGGYVLLVRPASAENDLRARRDNERRAIARLLDRRNIGGALRQLSNHPNPDDLAAFTRRMRRRLARIELQESEGSSALKKSMQFVRQVLLPLETAAHPEQAVREAQRAYQQLLLALRRDQIS